MAVYGKQADVIANQGRGVNLYIPGKTQLRPGDIFLGGTGTGVTDQELNGAQRVFGNTAEDTASAYGGYLKGSQSVPRQKSQSYRLPPGARPGLAMRQAMAQEDQFNRSLDSQQQQQDWQNNFNTGQLMGDYNGAPTLEKQAQAIQKAMQEAQLTGNYNGSPTMAASQFDKTFGLQQQQFNADNAYRNAALARSGGSGGSSGSTSANLSVAKYQNELLGQQALVQSMQGLQNLAMPQYDSAGNMIKEGMSRSELLEYVNANAGDLQANGVPVQDLYTWAAKNFTWDKSSDGWYNTAND